MHVMADDNTCDLYWCDILKFLCVLLLTTPSETVMEELLDTLEPMCDGELVHEFGARRPRLLLLPRRPLLLPLLLLLLRRVARLMTIMTMLEVKVMVPPPTLWMVLLSPTMSSPISMDTSGHSRALAYRRNTN